MSKVNTEFCTNKHLKKEQLIAADNIYHKKELYNVG